MQTFHFHLRDGQKIEDFEGEPCDSLEAAKRVAIETANQLANNRNPDDIAGQFVSVTDERGVEVFRTPLVFINS